MPSGDRTGPEGMGPMTGRGLGSCTGDGAPGRAGGGKMRRFRNRRGRRHGQSGGGAGWMRQVEESEKPGVPMNDRVREPDSAPPASETRDEQFEALKQQTQDLSNALEQLKSQIAPLEAPSQDQTTEDDVES